MRIIVIGAGVIGLSCAYELAKAGHAVTVVADHGPGDTVSSRAGALWFPYRVATTAPEDTKNTAGSEVADPLLERSLIRFIELAEQASTAVTSGDGSAAPSDLTDDIPPVELRRGMVRERRDPPDRSWVAPVVSVLGEDAVREVNGGVEVALPMIMTPTYLAWLMDSCRIAGVGFRWRKVESLAALCAGEYGTDAPEAVIVAGGLRGGELLGGDDEVTPIRGEIVVLANGTGEDGSPAPLTKWITDEDNPDGLVYVLPRVDDIVVGGSAEVGSWDETPNAELAEAILVRAEKLVPALAELPVLGHGAGLRPGRASLRIELVNAASVNGDDGDTPGGIAHAGIGEPVEGSEPAAGSEQRDGSGPAVGVPAISVPVIAAYGHGGAGVTLSWGTAERVAELIAEVECRSR